MKSLKFYIAILTVSVTSTFACKTNLSSTEESTLSSEGHESETMVFDCADGSRQYASTAIQARSVCDQNDFSIKKWFSQIFATAAMAQTNTPGVSALSCNGAAVLKGFRSDGTPICSTLSCRTVRGPYPNASSATCAEDETLAGGIATCGSHSSLKSETYEGKTYSATCMHAKTLRNSKTDVTVTAVCCKL